VPADKIVRKLANHNFLSSRNKPAPAAQESQENGKPKGYARDFHHHLIAPSEAR